MQVTVKDRQNVMDIALRNSGSIERSFDWALANGMSMSEEVETGVELLAVGTDNAAVVAGFANEPATRDGVEPALGGIDYMQIQTDFIVS